MTCLKGRKTFLRVVFDLLLNWTCHDSGVVSGKDLDLARESERLRRENRIPKGGEIIELSRLAIDPVDRLHTTTQLSSSRAGSLEVQIH